MANLNTFNHSEPRMRRDYRIKTPQLCEALGVSRMTLYTWERKGIFTPPRSMRGDRIFTVWQVKEIVKAFAPGGAGFWHFQPQS
jgi:predicted DNA-binding transcriptional regulator AlpA